MRVAGSEGIEFAEVATGKIRCSKNPLRLVSPANVKDMTNFPGGGRTVISSFGPDVVLATDGDVPVPVGLATICRCPLVVHEQTVRLGLANRTPARAVTCVAVSSESTVRLLPESARVNAVVTGNPVRPEVLCGQADKAIHAWTGADSTAPVHRLRHWRRSGFGVDQQDGRRHPAVAAVERQRDPLVRRGEPARTMPKRHRVAADQSARFHLTSFVGPELPDVLALADVVISCSGAGTIAELTALDKAAVYIPLASSGGGEPRHNARHLHEAGAAVALLDEVTPHAWARRSVRAHRLPSPRRHRATSPVPRGVRTQPNAPLTSSSSLPLGDARSPRCPVASGVLVLDSRRVLRSPRRESSRSFDRGAG